MLIVITGAVTIVYADDDVPLSVAEIFDKAIPGTVTIEAIRDSGGSLGTGFVYDAMGHIVTNAHVVEGAVEVDVIFSDKSRFDATIVGADARADLAVIKVDVDPSILKPLTMGNSSQLRIGEQVVAIGNPFGFTGSLTTGVVSQLGRSLSNLADLIQIDAAINRGNSGGPLLNMVGDVVGVNTAGLSKFIAEGVGFAVSSNTVTKIVPVLISDGKYDHPWIGVTISDIHIIIADIMDLSDTKGVLVYSVVPDSPADRAGLQGSNNTVQYNDAEYLVGGDIIVALDGVEIRNRHELSTYMLNFKSADDEMVMDVLRDGQVLQLVAVLDKWPSDIVQDPSGQDPSGQDPSGQDPSGQDPSGQDPSGQDPSGQDPSGQDPSGQDPSGQDPSGQDPSGQDPSGQDPSGQDPSGQDPSGQDPSGQDPSGQDPSGQDPSGQDPSGQDPSGQDPSGQDPSGQDPSGQDPSGQDPSGQDPSGQDPSGQDPSGQDPSGQPTATVRNPVGTSVPGCEATYECFIPSVVTVDVGSTVTWINEDVAAHTITSGVLADGGPDGVFDSGLFSPATEFSHTFEAAGEYPYFCLVHPWMNGLVIVQEASDDMMTDDTPVPEPEIGLGPETPSESGQTACRRGVYECLDAVVDLVKYERRPLCENCDSDTVSIGEHKYPTRMDHTAGVAFRGAHDLVIFNIKINPQNRLVMEDLRFVLQFEYRDTERTYFPANDNTAYRIEQSIRDIGLRNDIGIECTGLDDYAVEPLQTVKLCFPLPAEIRELGSLGIFNTAAIPNQYLEVSLGDVCGLNCVGTWDIPTPQVPDGYAPEARPVPTISYTYAITNADFYDHKFPSYSGTIERGAAAGLDAWSSINSVEFERVDDSSVADLIITMGGTGENPEFLFGTDTYGRVSDIGCLLDRADDCSITLFVEDESSGSVDLLTEEMIRFVTAHEVGHALGFKHHGSATHVMYSPLDNTKSWYDDEAYGLSAPDISRPQYSTISAERDTHIIHLPSRTDVYTDPVFGYVDDGSTDALDALEDLSLDALRDRWDKIVKNSERISEEIVEIGEELFTRAGATP